MPKILVVDDEKHIVELIFVLLEEEPEYQLLAAYDAATALRLIEAEEPDVVLLDYMMPDRNGLDLLKEIKERWPDCYVIIVTGKGSEKIAVDLMKAGAADYLSKPFKAEELLDVLKNVLKFRESQLRAQERSAARRGVSASRMVTGFNDNITYQGTTFHVQTEDGGLPGCVVSSAIYSEGAVVASRQIDYSRLRERENLPQVVMAVVKRLHHEMVEQLLLGKFDDRIAQTKGAVGRKR